MGASPCILLITIRALGDTVLITPIIRAVKERYPTSRLLVVAEAMGAGVLLHNPHIDRLLVIDRGARRRIPWHRRLHEEWLFIRDIRRERPDLAIDLFSGPRSAVLGFLAGAPVRYGEDTRRHGRGFLYTHRVRVRTVGAHLVEQKFQIIADMVPTCTSRTLELVLSEKEQAWARQRMAQKGFAADDLIVGLFPGAGWGHKRWPVDRFARLGDLLRERHGAKILLLGGVRDQEVTWQVCYLMRQPPAVMDEITSVRELMALIGQSRLFISNDTGPMHIAVALGIPTVALFGPSDLTKYGPWGENGAVVSKRLPCSPCPQQVDTCHEVGRARQECMLLITMEEVLEAVNRTRFSSHLHLSQPR